VIVAVLLYRALTWLLPIPVGIGCYLWWRRRSWVASATTVPSAVGAGSHDRKPTTSCLVDASLAPAGDQDMSETAGRHGGVAALPREASGRS